MTQIASGQRSAQATPQPTRKKANAATPSFRKSASRVDFSSTPLAIARLNTRAEQEIPRQPAGAVPRGGAASAVRGSSRLRQRKYTAG